MIAAWRMLSRVRVLYFPFSMLVFPFNHLGLIFSSSLAFMYICFFSFITLRFFLLSFNFVPLLFFPFI